VSALQDRMYLDPLAVAWEAEPVPQAVTSELDGVTFVNGIAWFDEQGVYISPTT